MAVSITIATGEDAEALHAALLHLVPQLSRSNPAPDLAAVRGMLGHDSVTQFLARDDEGTVVGVATLAAFPIPTAVRSWVEDVIVDEARNNQGIGRLLLDAMVTRAAELGAKTVDLTSRPSREAANHLYLKAGFVERETTVYRLTLEVE
ncbi:MAG: GNAT family N-acetyltransferase [Acidimicrobiales bacterium]